MMCTGAEIPALMAAAAEIAPEGEAALGGIDALQAAGLGGMGVAQNGIGAGTLGASLMGAASNPSSLLSPDGLLANTAKGAFRGGGGGGAGGLLAAQMGMNMMNPQKPQMAPPAPHGGGGGQPAPLPMPYGTSSGNSLGGQMPLTPDQIRKLKMMGMI